MRSTEGTYLPKLDHLRGIAAILVFFWHGVHALGVPVAAVPLFPPGSILEEGHIGVSLFMTLSGYIFAKKLNGKSLIVPLFLYNRLLRLAPLLAVVIAYYTAMGIYDIRSFPSQFVTCCWPGGAWSIAIEMQFYFLLPILLYALRARGAVVFSSLVLASLVFRAAQWGEHGESQWISYWTIGGRIDQFVLGMAFASARNNLWFRKHATLFVGISFAVLLIYAHIFNLSGGYYGTERSWVWVVLPAVEGLVFAVLIAAYDSSSVTLPAKFGWFLEKSGEASYSIYMWHVIFIVLVTPYLLQTASFGVASLMVAIGFFPLLIVSTISFQVIEKPFLKLRVPYIVSAASAKGDLAALSSANPDQRQDSTGPILIGSQAQTALPQSPSSV